MGSSSKTQKRDIFIQDFTATVTECQLKLYKLFLNPDTAFSGPSFLVFNQLRLFNHESIKLTFQIDMNELAPTLVFLVGDKSLPARHEGERLIQLDFTVLLERIKSDVIEAAAQMLDEVKSRFPSHNLMDALGVLYPQYWQQENDEVHFRKHLTILEDFYCMPKWIDTEVDGSRRLIPPLFDRCKLEEQQIIFKCAMIHNCDHAMELPPMGTSKGQVVNPPTKLWRSLDANPVLSKTMDEYVKLAQLAMVHVLGSVEDERCFSSLTFLKDKVRNRLDGDHLSLVVGMKAQQVYTLENFPYDACFKQWVHSVERYRYGTNA